MCLDRRSLAVGLDRVIFEACLAEQQQKTPHWVQTLLVLGGDMLGPAEDPGKDGGDGGGGGTKHQQERDRSREI